MRKISILIGVFALFGFVPEVAFAAGNCSFMGSLLEWAKVFWYIIAVAGPVLFIIFSLVDLAKTLTSGEDAAFKKYTGKTVKRLIAVLILVLLPVLVNALLSLIDSSYGTCGIE